VDSGNARDDVDSAMWSWFWFRLWIRTWVAARISKPIEQAKPGAEVSVVFPTPPFQVSAQGLPRIGTLLMAHEIKIFDKPRSFDQNIEEDVLHVLWDSLPR
jgi:hypothetical protein